MLGSGVFAAGVGGSGRNHTVSMNSIQTLKCLCQGRKLKYWAACAGQWPSIMACWLKESSSIDQTRTVGLQVKKQWEERPTMKGDTVPCRGPVLNQFFQSFFLKNGPLFNRSGGAASGNSVPWSSYSLYGLSEERYGDVSQGQGQLQTKLTTVSLSHDQLGNTDDAKDDKHWEL